MARGGLDDPRLTEVGLFVEAYAGLMAEMATVQAVHGLNGTDFDTLLRLGRSPGRRLRMSDLAAQTALSTSGITRIVDRLARRDLVRREPCLEDRRSWWAVLTDEGEEILEQVLPPTLDAIQRHYFDPLGPGQREALAGALRVLRDRLRPDAAAVTPESA